MDRQGDPCRFADWPEWRTRLYGCWCILRGKPAVFKATLYIDFTNLKIEGTNKPR